MNVKTILTLKSTKLTILVFTIIATLLFVILCLIAPSKDIDCVAEININIHNNDEQVDIDGTVSYFYHFIKKGESHVSEYGSVVYNNKKYILDRTARILATDTKNTNYKEIRKDNIKKNFQDNMPDNVYDIIMSKQKVLFWRIQAFSNDLLQVTDLRRSLMICKKMQ